MQGLLFAGWSIPDLSSISWACENPWAQSETILWLPLCFEVRWWLTTGRAGRQIKYLIPFIRQDINRSTVFLHAVFNPPFPWSAASQCPQYPISPLDAIDHRVMIRIDQDDHGWLEIRSPSASTTVPMLISTIWPPNTNIELLMKSIKCWWSPTMKLGLIPMMYGCNAQFNKVLSEYCNSTVVHWTVAVNCAIVPLCSCAILTVGKTNTPQSTKLASVGWINRSPTIGSILRPIENATHRHKFTSAVLSGKENICSVYCKSHDDHCIAVTASIIRWYEWAARETGPGLATVTILPFSPPCFLLAGIITESCSVAQCFTVII